MTIKQIIFSLVAASACVGGGLVTVAAGDDTAPTAPPRATAAPDATASFAVFQRPATAGDQMPPETRRMLAPIAEREGADVDRARAVAPSAGRAVWAIPGQDKVCLAIPDPVDGFGINCSDVMAAKSGRLWVTLVGLPNQGLGDVRIAQFVPDGVDAVVADSDATGESRTIPTTDNVAFADATSGTIGFSDGFGEHRVRVEGTPQMLLSGDR